MADKRITDLTAETALTRVDTFLETDHATRGSEKSSVENLLNRDQNNQTGAAYTLVLTDSQKRLTMNNASANAVTIPPNSSVAFPINSVIPVFQLGAGRTSFVAGSGVTINSLLGSLKIAGRYGHSALVKTAADVWSLYNVGDAVAENLTGTASININGTVGAATPAAVTSTVVSAADGTVSAPSITNTGDTDTGIYFPAANEIALSAGNHETLKVTSAGVSLSGTTGSLDIHATPGASTKEGGQISLHTADSYDSTYPTWGIDTYEDYLRHIVGGAVIMAWLPDGSVNIPDSLGIGTVSPSTKLHVSDGGSSPSLNAATMAVFNNSSGVSDYAAAAIIGGANGASYLAFGDTADEDVGIIFYSHASNFMSLTTNAAERIRILSDGKVGIGTATPDTKLEVVGENTNQLKVASTSGSTTKLNLGQFSSESYIFNNYAYEAGHTTDDATKASSGIVLGLGSIKFQYAAASATPARSTIATISSTGLAVTGAISTLGADGVTINTSTSPQSKLRLNTNSSASGDRNWALTTNYTQAGNFEIKQSAALGGDAYSGTAIGTFSSAGVAVTGAISSTTGANLATASGYVGIGTASPSSGLHVAKATTAGHYLAQFRQNTTSQPFGVNINEASGSTTGYPMLDVMSSSGATFFRVNTGTGNVGIGANPDGGSNKLQVTGPITTTGNLVISTAGKGIDFSATSGSGTSELFDDYEEGTWTPVIRGSSTAGTYEISQHYSSYTKVGRLVTLSCKITLASSITAGGSGYTKITGAPFAKVANTAPNAICATKGVDYAGSFITVEFDSPNATSNLYLTETLDNGGGVDLPIANLAAYDIFVFTISYEV